jgi:predicted metal-dependent hydrolase
VLKHSKMILRAGSGTSHDARRAVIAQWYRDQIRCTVPDLLAKWEPIIGVRVKRIFVQKMKTKWGSCNPASRSIRPNTDLAKKPRKCLEYILVHEMVHLLERRHNERFRGYMDRFMPHWHEHRDELNRAPLNHENWIY